MAGQNRIVSESFIASGDLSTMQHRFVDLVAAGEIVGHALANGGIGVLLNKPLDGEHATVALSGRVRVDAGVAITAGQFIVSAASGFAIPEIFSLTITSADNFTLIGKTVLGRAMSTAASGSVFALELAPFVTNVVST
jgi:hypothetical protein